ncbi:MAG: DUF5309 family protein [Bacteroidales bacterium]|nr:DUF5309 family protein [Bacteroidales bacterium]
MAKIDTSKLTTGELIDLSKEITLVGVQDTPFMSYLLANNQIDTANSKVATWRKKELDTTADVGIVEGADATTFYNSSRAELSNVMEIFYKAVSISGTTSAININGIPNLLQEELTDRLTEIKVNAENKLINGVKDDGSLDPFIRRMDGLASWIPAKNAVETAGALEESHIKSAIRKIWDSGISNGHYLGFANADVKEQIDALYESKYSYQALTTDFGLVVYRILTNYGNMDLIIERNIPAKKLFVISPKFFKLTYLRKPAFEMLAKAGDSIKGHCVMEATLKCLNPAACASMEITAGV